MSLYVLFVSTLFFISCSDDAVSVNDQLDAFQLKSATKMKTVEEERLVFGMLDNSEKFLIWKDKLENILATEKLNSIQKSLIRELLSKIKIEAWDKNDDYHAYFTNIYLKNFLSRAGSNFDDTKMVNYFYRTAPINELEASISKANASRASNCACLKTELIHFDCGIFNTSTCTTSSTCSTVDGCGALNTSFCDGRCT